MSKQQTESQQDTPADEDKISYVVITDGRGPFDTGEILVCAPLPGSGVREIGHPSRKPLKWNIEYETFGTAERAVQRREELSTISREWVPTDG